MTIKPGTVAFWYDLFPGSDKFVYFLGTYIDKAGLEHACYFTISSQTKWVSVPAKRREMLEMPKGAADYLHLVSYIQCWNELGTIPLSQFHALKCVTYRGELPQFLPALRMIVENSDILSRRDIDKALAAIPVEKE